MIAPANIIDAAHIQNLFILHLKTNNYKQPEHSTLEVKQLEFQYSATTSILKIWGPVENGIIKVNCLNPGSVMSQVPTAAWVKSPEIIGYNCQLSCYVN